VSKKKPKVDRLTVKIPMYYAKVEFYICDDLEAVSDLLPHCIKSSSWNLSGVACCHYTYRQGEEMQRRPIIQMTKHHISDAGHEIIHACTWILKEAGIDPGNDTGEGLAYLYDFIMDKYLDKFWEIK
jgi:hypothetical protein